MFDYGFKHCRRILVVWKIYFYIDLTTNNKLAMIKKFAKPFAKVTDLYGCLMQRIRHNVTLALLKKVFLLGYFRTFIML